MQSGILIYNLFHPPSLLALTRQGVAKCVKIVGIIPTHFAPTRFPGIQFFLLLLLFWLLPTSVYSIDASLKKRSPDQVLLVVNTSSPISRAIGDDYTVKRQVRNILSIQCQDSALNTKNETIALADYVQSIENPIRDYLATHTNIDFIVLTKGIPIRITGAAMGSCDEHSREPENIRGHPSVDSTLAALDYASLPGAMKIDIAGSGAIGCAYSNRYWNATEPFSHAKFGGYLVTRLDGYTEADAKALVTRSLAAEKNIGQILTQGEVLLDVEPIFGLGDKATQPGPDHRHEYSGGIGLERIQCGHAACL